MGDFEERLRDRFRGALLGATAGDALGMPVEGMPHEAIFFNHGELREMLDARLGRGTYTDDAQMTIGLAEAFLDSPGEIDQEAVARRFAENHDVRRGYGGNASRILEAIKQGTRWQKAMAANLPPGGSYGNGAAMRAAPAALAFYPDPEAVARAAEVQAEVTGHTHPLALFGARIQALSVLRALECGVEGKPFDAAPFLDELIGRGPKEYDQSLEWIKSNLAAPPEEAVKRLGAHLIASRSVPTAIWAFLSIPESAEEAIVRAVNLGGDTDTIGAMAGAIAGAYHGASGLPDRWLDVLENGEKGRDYILTLADKLADRAIAKK